LIDINTLVTETFHNNVTYLQKYHPLTFAKLSALDSAITNRHYQERYELVYENDNFDVFERNSMTYLYAKDSSSHTRKAVKEVEFNLNNDLFEGFERHKFTREEMDLFKKEKRFDSHLPSIAPIIDYINKNTNTAKTLKSLDKFIFFGTGLALHIKPINTKIKSKVYLIIEDDLELFRLSLFTMNYQQLSQDSKLFFSVFEDQDEANKTFNDFLQEQPFLNHYIKYFHILSHSEKKIDEFHVTLTSQPHLRFLFHNLLLKYKQALNYLFDDYKFLQQNISLQKTKINKTPFLLLAMGPSLEKNIAWLKKNHSKFVIVAVSSTLSYLEKENIPPNIILHIDPFTWGDISFKKLNSIDFIKDSICLFSTATAKNITSLINKEMLFFFETGTSYKSASMHLSSPCVGSLAYQLLLVLHTKTIYILGLDLAVDSDTNSTHSSTHQFNTTIKDNESSITYKDSLIEVNGNMTNRVKTTPHFNASIQVIDYFVPKLKSNKQHIYNLSSGSKLSGADGRKCTDIKSENIDFLMLQKEIKLFLDANSSDDLSTDDKINFAKKLEQAIELKEKIINGIDLFNIIDYLDLKISNESTELDKILDSYLRYILSYIYDFFNSQNIKNYDQHLSTLNSLLTKELLDIIQYYISTIETSSNPKGKQWKR